MADTPPLRVLPHVPKNQTPSPWPDLVAMLEEFVADVKAGKIDATSAVVFYVSKEANGALRPHFWTFNTSITEQIGFGHLLAEMSLEEWRS